MLRDIIFSAMVLFMVPACYRKPFIGLVMFSWLAYMRPQDLTWGFAREQRWSYLIAVTTFLGFVKSRPTEWFLRDWRNYVMLLMIAVVGISGAASKYASAITLNHFMEFAKILIIAMFTTVVVRKREQLRILLWIIALSLGFYGVKSGIWGIMTLGRVAIIRGPGGMMLDNNALALALAMAVPILVHLGLTERHRLVKYAFLVSVPLCAFTVMLTHSRGGFLSLSCGLAVLVWHSRNRVAVISAAMLLAVAAFILAPSEYKDRISTIADYETEGSAQGRIRSWGIGYRMAMANPVLGVGIEQYVYHYNDYATEPGHGVIVAHNSFIQIWAESGTISLILYLALLASCFLMIWQVRARARHHFYTSWILNYCTMFEGCMVAFTVGGMFLNKAHFDLFYHMVAIILVFGRMAFAEMEDPVKYPLRDGNRGQISFSQARLFGGKQISKSREFRDPQPAFGGRRTTQTLTTGTLKKRQS